MLTVNKIEKPSNLKPSLVDKAVNRTRPVRKKALHPTAVNAACKVVNNQGHGICPQSDLKCKDR